MPNKVLFSDFGKEARKLMIEKGIGYKDISENVGICYGYIYDIFIGNRNSEKRKKQIADYLGMKNNQTQQ